MNGRRNKRKPAPKTMSGIITPKVPEWAEGYVLETGLLSFHGEVVTYHVLSVQFAKDNRAPEIFTIHDHLGSGFLAVSKACPKQWRDLVLIHELIEHKMVGNVQPHNCLCALVAELEIVRERRLDDEKEYITFRRKFFEEFVTYYAEKTAQVPNAVEEAILASIRISLAYLNELCRE